MNIGDKVVYPMYGAGVIEALEEREVLGESRFYYIMKLPLGEMRVMIPSIRVDELGLRDVVTVDGVDGVLGVLKGDATPMPDNWNERYRLHTERIRRGNACEIAEVVRNLTARDRAKGLSGGEQRILDSARQILISEVVLADGVTAGHISELLQLVF